ncbi:Uncharacterized protein APZ42_024755 [Daphnia magna]|uniref:Uncharacterized protein n=1 Tax=Daphnia magna TaxID=35525 RepID=A0A164TTA4_9CRUS|nr:Uncharacterized protein APZ42_024755 [Daphnia magna]
MCTWVGCRAGIKPVPKPDYAILSPVCPVSYQLNQSLAHNSDNDETLFAKI